ncbi:MAG TPA: hypothetical protein VFU20_05235, partial [Sphingomicrobium sp.]|nr:hypothetical protein [Sphingomicrobium sp.]
LSVTMTQLLTIYADFQNADREGYVRLNTEGTQADLCRVGLALSEGLRLCLSDGELRTTAVVVQPGTEGVWRAKIDWSGLSQE